MGKVLIAYYSRTGKTEKMAEYIAEGVRFSGNSAEIKKLADIKNETELEGYDGYAFGCPTYHRDMTANMKTFLFLVEKAGLNGKVGALLDPTPTVAMPPVTSLTQWSMYLK